MRADAQQNYDHLLAVAREVIIEQGAQASLRDVARRAGVGLGTLYRHFPTREALLEALLRVSADELTAKAGELEVSSSAQDALVSWVRDAVEYVRNYHGVTELMAAALDDPDSALHASCTGLRAAGARLLARAQHEGVARTDLDGTELFALIAALGWLGDQAPLAPRADHLFDIIVGAVVTKPAGSASKAAGRRKTPR
jgi:AcrR family transcriptional regulator